MVLTTSGGDIYPNTKDRGIDAVTSASTKADIQPVSNVIISKIDRLIE